MADFELKITRGDTLPSGTVTLALLTEGTPDVPINMTGATVLMQLRRYADSSTVDLTVPFTVAGNTLTSAAVSAAVTQTLSGNYVADVQTILAGITETWVSIDVVVQPDISR